MSAPAAARNALVRQLVRTVWGVRERVLERPRSRAVLRTIGRPGIWLMHATAGKAPPAPPAEPGGETVIHLPLDYRFAPFDPPPRIAVLIHAYYPELLGEILDHLQRLPAGADLLVSTDLESKRPAIEESLERWSGGRVVLRVAPNRGRNIAPQLVGFADLIGDYDLLLLVHTKKSLHWDALAGWRSAMLRDLLPSADGIAGILESFRRLPALGMAAPSIYAPTRRHMVWAPNFATCRDLADRLGVALSPDSPLDFPAGTMLWARPAALKPLLGLGLRFEDFEPEAGQTDGTLAHALERLLFHSCELAGLRWVRVRAGLDAVWPERFLRADSPHALRRAVTDLGRTLLLPGRPPDPTRTEEDLGAPATPEERKAAFRAACREELDAFLAGEGRLQLPTAEPPEISILLVLFNQAELTFQCLRSLRFALDRPSEVIIVDNASSDRTGELLARLDGARIVRNPDNRHFLRAVNQAAALARGQALLLLNNDARVRPGSIAAACEVLGSEPDVGAVAARIVLLDGTLQEAGSIIWRDGACAGVGRGADPEAAEFQFRRDVDYGSGAFLMIRRSAFERLGGLDEAFAPAYYEETDFCMRLREAGLRVVYEPCALIWHFEFGSASSAEAALALQREHHQVFVDRHRARLQSGHLERGAPAIEARMRSAQRRLLIIEDQVPYADLGAGYPRALELIRAARAAGWFVTLYPTVYPDADYATAYAGALPPEVEIAAERGAAGLAPFMQERRGYYDAVIVSRPHNMKVFKAALAEVRRFISAHRVIYDAEAIFAARDLARTPGPEARAAVRAETVLARRAAAVLAVSGADAAQFRGARVSRVRIVGHAVEARPTAPGFAARSDLLFVGALDEDHSPNADSLRFFVGEVAPKLDALIGEDWRLWVAGRNGAAGVQALASDRVRLLGRVPDLGDLYARARLFIAPTRFAAGIPMKVHEAAARGLPVVATSLLARQLGWRSGEELLVADAPDAFAQACARLYTDAELWARIRAAGLGAVERDCSPERFRSTVAEVLDAVAPVRR